VYPTLADAAAAVAAAAAEDTAAVLGDQCYATSDNEMHFWNGTDWVSLRGCTGARGRGERGLAGVGIAEVCSTGPGPGLVVVRLTDGSEYTLDLPPGPPGRDGAAVQSVEFATPESDAAAEVRVVMTDGAVHTASVPLPRGPQGPTGPRPVTYVTAGRGGGGARPPQPGQFPADTTPPPSGVVPGLGTQLLDMSTRELYVYDGADWVSLRGCTGPRGRGERGLPGVGIATIANDPTDSRKVRFVLSDRDATAYTIELPRGCTGATGPKPALEPRIITELGIEHAPLYYDITSGDLCLLVPN
jgi:hypothetical protein